MPENPVKTAFDGALARRLESGGDTPSSTTAQIGNGQGNSEIDLSSLSPIERANLLGDVGQAPSVDLSNITIGQVGRQLSSLPAQQQALAPETTNFDKAMAIRTSTNRVQRNFPRFAERIQRQTAEAVTRNSESTPAEIKAADGILLTREQYLSKYGDTAQSDREYLNFQAPVVQRQIDALPTRDTPVADAATTFVGTSLGIVTDTVAGASAVAINPPSAIVGGINNLVEGGLSLFGLDDEYTEATGALYNDLQQALNTPSYQPLPEGNFFANILGDPLIRATFTFGSPESRRVLLEPLLDAASSASSRVRRGVDEGQSPARQERLALREEQVTAYSAAIDEALPEDASFTERALANARKALNFIETYEPQDLAIEGFGQLPYLFTAGQIAKGAAVSGEAAAASRLDALIAGRTTPTAALIERNAPNIIRAEGAAAADVAVTGAVGVLEGTANATQTYNEVIETSFEDLQANSPAYRALVAGGQSPESARQQLATQASANTAIATGVLAAGISRVVGNTAEVSAGGVATTGTRTIASTVGTVARSTVGEVVEEGLQSASGEILSDVAVRAAADENLEIGEGALRAGVEGALIGGISAGATTTVAETPRTAVALLNRVRTSADAEAPQGTRANRELLAEVENLVSDTPRNDAGQVRTSELDAASQATLARARALVQGARDNAALTELSPNEEVSADDALALANSLVESAPTVAQADTLETTTTEDVNRTNTTLRDIPAEELTTANVDDFIASLSLQLDLEDSANPVDITSIETTRALLAERGATPAQLERVDSVIRTRRTISQVSDFVRIGDAEWRGGGTYLNSIVQGLTNNAPATIAFNLAELQRFTNYMIRKAEAFSNAAPNTDVLRPDGSIYQSLDGTPLFANSPRLVASIAADRDALLSILDVASQLVEDNVQGANAQQLLEQLNISPIDSQDVSEGFEPVTVANVSLPTEAPLEAPTEPVVETVDEEIVGDDAQIDVETTDAIVADITPAVEEPVEANPAQPTASVASTEDSNRSVENSQGTRAIREGLFNTLTDESPAYPESLGANVRDTTRRYFERNEFQEEARVRPNSQVGNNIDAFDNDSLRETLSSRGASETSNDTLVATVDSLDLPNQANLLNTRFRGILDAALTRVREGGNRLYIKNYTGSKSNFEDVNGDLFFPIRNGATIAMIDHINTDSPGDRRRAIRNIAGLDSKQDPTPALYAYLDGVQLGTSASQLVQQLGSNALRVAGITFTGEQGNTFERTRDAIGQMVLEHMVEEGYLQREELSYNLLKQAGGGTVTTFNAPSVNNVRSFIEGSRLPANTVFRYNEVVYLARGNGETSVLTPALARTLESRTAAGSASNVFAQFVDMDTFFTYSLNTENEYVSQVRDGFRGEGSPSTSAFSRLFGTESDTTKPALFEPRRNGNTINRFPHIRVGERLVRIINKGSRIEFRLNENMVNLQEALGVEAFRRISGFREVPAGTNRNLSLGIEGKNQSVEANLAQLNEFYDDVRSAIREGTGDIALHDVPIFFNYDVQSNNRLRVNSQTLNYQSNKMHRTMIHGGRETFTKGGEQDANFLVGVAQSFGISVDKLSLGTSLNRLSETLPAAVTAMQRFHSTGVMTSQDANTIADFAASHEGNHTLLGLDEYARYLVAADGTEISTAMEVEIDGVNNGPITALIHSMTNPERLRHYLRRAGIVPTESGDLRTHGERVEQDNLDGLYEESQRAIQDSLQEAIASNDISEQERTILRAQLGLKIREGNVSIDEDTSTISVSRNDSKGITTTLFYGAGNKSVIMSDARGMVNAFYAALQEIQDSDTTEAAKASQRNTLFREFASASVDASPTFERGQRTPRPIADLRQQFTRTLASITAAYAEQGHEEFTLPTIAETAFYTGMLNNPNSYGNLKANAVREHYGDALEQFSDIAKLGTVSNIIARVKINALLDAERTAQGLSGLEDISQDRRNEILRENAEQLPNIRLSHHDGFEDAIPWYKWGEGDTRSTDSRRFGLVVPNRGDASFTNSATITDIGAGANPIMIQPIADGAVIIHTMDNATDSFKTVFDGLYGNVLNQNTAVPVYNQGYINSQRNHNPMALASDAYNRTINISEDFLNGVPQGDYGRLIRQVLPELQKTLGLPSNVWYAGLQAATPQTGLGSLSAEELRAQVFEGIQNLGRASTQLAEERSLASRYLTENSVVSNQFGSVNNLSPIIGGTAALPNASTPLADLAEEDVGVTEVSGNSGSLEDFLIDNDIFVGTSTVATATILGQLVDFSNNNAAYKTWLRDVVIARILAPVFQRRGELPTIVITDDSGIRTHLGIDTRVKGAYDSSTNTVYLNRNRGGANTETMFHELIHAALDTQLTPQDEARLQRLVDEFGNEAVNSPRELLAWGLTNFNEMTRLAQQTTEESPQNVYGRILSFVRGMISRLINAEAPRNSVLSFLFETAHAAANNDMVYSVRDTTVSLQRDMRSNLNQNAQQVLDLLVRDSNVSSAHAIRLSQVLHQDILPILTNAQHRLSARINTVEALKELREADISIAPDSLTGVLGMSPAESYIFESYREIVRAGLQDFDINARVASSLFNRARREISPEVMGQVQYEAVFNAGEGSVTNFIALSATNENFRALLDDVNLRVQTDRGFKALISTTIGLINSLIGGLGTGTARIRNLPNKLARLSGNLTAIDTRHKSFLERSLGGVYTRAGTAYNVWGTAADNALRRILASDTVQGTRAAIGTAGRRAGNFITGRNNPSQAANYTRLYRAIHNFADGAVPAFIEEVSGTNPQNRDLRRLFIDKNKSIAGARDTTIKAHERNLQGRLSDNALTTENSSALTRVILETDITSLQADGFTVEDIERLISNPVSRQEAIETLEAELRGLTGANADVVVKSARSMGNSLITGAGTESITYSNAFAALFHIGNTFGADVSAHEAKFDALASLVALNHADIAEERTLVAELYATDRAGIADVLQLHQENKDFVRDSQHQGNRFLARKGNVSEIFDNFRDIRYVPASELRNREMEGYTVVRRLRRDRDDPNSEALYIMFSQVGGLQGFQQGLVSTINGGLSGVRNLDNRITTNGIDDYANMQRSSARMRLNKQRALRAMNTPADTTRTDGTFVVTNSRGTVTGFQYVLPKAEREELLGRDVRIQKVLPAMFGRAVEATNTVPFNERVNRALKATYDADRAAGRLRGYIEVSATSTNRRGREAYRMMPPAARDDLREIWGERAFVREGLFDQVYGFRRVSIAQAIAANNQSNWPVQLVRRVAGGYTPNVIRGVANIERALTELSGFIKDTIVVRGVEVLVGNLLSNTVQLLLSEDISIVNAIRLQVRGLQLAKAYQVNASRIRQLDVEISLEPTNTTLINERARLQEEQANNGAAPLIEAGLLSTIVEDVAQDDNPFSFGQRLSDRVTGYTSALPNSVQWLGSNLIANKNSEIYQTLYMFTQLGDFGARYAMLENRRAKGTLTENSVDDAVDAFINYDLPSNKYLQYLGDVGQLWFFKYFFRIQSVIIRNTLRNPRRAAEFALVTGLTGVDIPSYFDAFFLFNNVTNKMGLLDYVGNGFESIPIVQVYDAL